MTTTATDSASTTRTGVTPCPMWCAVDHSSDPPGGYVHTSRQEHVADAFYADRQLPLQLERFINEEGVEHATTVTINGDRDCLLPDLFDAPYRLERQFPAARSTPGC